MDCIVHELAKSQTRLSNFHFGFSLILAAPGDILGPQPVMETMLHAVEAWSQLWDPQGCLPGDFFKASSFWGLFWGSFMRWISYVALGGPSYTTCLTA